MTDVVLFTDNTENIQISIPLGAFKVASVLRKAGYDTLVVNHFSNFTIDELKTLIDRAVDTNTKLIGFSTTFFNRLSIINGKRTYQPIGFDTIFPLGKEVEDQFISYVKTKYPDIKFMVGGSKAIPDYFNTNINYVCVGYSEDSVVNLLNHLSAGEDLKHSYINEHGITIIDDRKAANYSFADDDMVWQKTDIVNHRVLPLEIGRGCIFKCKFCSFPLQGKKGFDHIKKPEVLYKELLDNYERHGITHYLIVDDTFNDYTDKLKSIESVVTRLPFQPKFWCYARLDLICTRPETLDILYNIGVRGMYFGIETLDLTAGKIIGKGFDREKQIEMLHHIRKTYPDIALHGSFIAGLPRESLESIKLTCYQLENGQIPLHSWMIRPLLINENTTSLNFNSDINVNYEKYGYESAGVYSGYILWKNEHTSIFEAKDLSTKCMENSRKKEYFHVPGHDSFEMLNYGCDVQETMLTPFKDFDFHLIETIKYDSFMTEYKFKLMQLIDNAQVVELVDTQR